MVIAGLPVSERLRLSGETAIVWAAFDPGWYLAAYPEAAKQLADRSPGSRAGLVS